MQRTLTLHLYDETELAGSSWDTGIREALCDSFPLDAAAFTLSRAWHGSAPDFAVFLADGSRVVAHAAIVSREVLCGDLSIRVAGLQGVCVRPEMRGRHLLDDVLARAMEESDTRGFDQGLLFCLPEIEKVYSRRGWVRIPNDPILCLDECHHEGPLPGKNIAMAYSLRLARFPTGPLHLQGRDW